MGINLAASGLRQHHKLLVVQHVGFMPQKLCKKQDPKVMAEVALDNWQPVWNAHVLISTPVCVNYDLHPGSGDIYIYIYICWRLISADVIHHKAVSLMTFLSCCDDAFTTPQKNRFQVVHIHRDCAAPVIIQRIKPHSWWINFRLLSRFKKKIWLNSPWCCIYMLVNWVIIG